MPEHTHIKHTHIGGQAVLEGVMMRGKFNWAVAVRAADGHIHTEQHELGGAGSRPEWTRWPVIRGMVGMYDTLALALKAFSVSATMASVGEEEEQLSDKEIGISMLIGLGFAVVLFIIVPALATDLLGRFFHAAKGNFAWNIIDGVLRLAIFFLYIWGVSRMKDIQRLFAYHGAEHKTIHAYEAGLPLETRVIQKYGTEHVRCGTSFLLMVMVIAIFVFSVLPAPKTGIPFADVLARIAVRLVLVPLIAGLAYEVIKYAGNHADNPFVKVILTPGLWLQRMTTRQPDDSMVEVAVAALAPVVAREEHGAPLPEGIWPPEDEADDAIDAEATVEADADDAASEPDAPAPDEDLALT
jgi:uncharacterized protein YqhQ